MLKRGKKGLSPVVSTVLLIMIVVILAAIIVIWLRYFMKDAIVKFEKPIERTCEDVSFEATLQGSKIILENTGSVPIEAIVLHKKKPGATDVEKIGGEGNDDGYDDGKISAGGSKIISVDLSGYEEIKVIPVLLGEVEKKDTIREFECNEDFGIELVI